METAPRQLSVRLGVVVVVIIGVFLLIGGPADAEANPVPPVEYVVSAGDSLWAIASEHTPAGADVRNLIEEIKEVTGITSSSIYPGQILLIPQD